MVVRFYDRVANSSEKELANLYKYYEVSALLYKKCWFEEDSAADKDGDDDSVGSD